MIRTASRLLVLVLVSTAVVHAQSTPTDGGSPRVSPDGSGIVFWSDRSGSARTYVIRSDGTNIHLLSDDRSFSGAWSPDGKRLVYFIPKPEQMNAIVVINADGTGARVISEAKGNQSPSWSPDGRIVFAAGDMPSRDIYTMRSDGSQKQLVSRIPGFYGDPVWSPDRKRIAFVSYTRDRGPRIFIMNADGTDQHELSHSDGLQERPAWSPDGRRVAFQSAITPSGSRSASDAFIEIVDVESGVETRVGAHPQPAFDETPSWFPDGRRLAIQSRRSGRWEIYVIDLEGRVLAQLTK